MTWTCTPLVPSRINALIAVSVFTVLATAPILGGTPQVHSTSTDPAAARAEVRSVFDRYCVTCHNERSKAGGLSLQVLALDNIPSEAERLEKIVKKLRAGAMPPLGSRRPDSATHDFLVGWLESQLDQVAVAHPNPGRTQPLHRLNRAEYQNAIRDLLDVEGLRFSTVLPSDDASYGFDNIAGVLGMSPTHLEQYINAARLVSRYAVGDVTLSPDGETDVIRPDLSQDNRLEEMPFGTRGGALLRRYFPVDANYVIRFQAFTGVGVSEEEPNYVELAVDGRRVFYERMAQKPIRSINNAADVQANTDWEIRVPIKAGLRTLTVTFTQTTFSQHDDLLQPFLRPPGISSFRTSRVGGYAGPYIGQVSFTGPFDTTGPGDTPARRRIFLCTPSSDRSDEACARQILSSLARRAYRRPVNHDDVETLLTFYRKGRADASFERGIQIALERLLASPEFLYRLEVDPAEAETGRPYAVSDLELASRLSFFLWSSIPDDELLAIASRRQLKDPKVLDRQVRRMLADPRSEALTNNFAGQWLHLRALPGIERNAQMFPDFDDNLRQAMRRETELFFDSIVREDRSLLDLLNADYTFVNERLARHYGIPNVYGSQYRRVTLTNASRRGLLGQASILTVTGQANRTSPVTRGKWILENILGTPPPAPPADVPALEQTELKGTLRQRMEQHRRNPVCATCHKVMDPLGFALENFDPVGQWRSKDEGRPVDATGTMPDGAEFDGVDALRTAILAKPDVVAHTLTEKLMIYALGRGVEYYDAPAIRQIVRMAAKDQYRLSHVIVGIVKSAPFQMRLPVSPTAVPAN